MTKFLRLATMLLPLLGPSILPAFGAVTPLSGVVSVSVGIDFSCAVRSDGSVWCWGSNDAGQLGVATPALSNGLRIALNPVKLNALTNATMVASGWGHSCALRSDGTVWCWGSNGAGQLGNGSLVNSAVPVRVMGLPAAKSIHLGATSSCAVSQDNRAWCWGDFYSINGGLLPERRFNEQLATPGLISTLTDVRSLTLGDESVCALVLNGPVYCWGYDGDGRIGDGGASNSPRIPQRVSGLSDGQSVAASYSGFCSSRQTGAVVCWGEFPNVDNGFGSQRANVPTTIDLGRSAVSIFANPKSYCAIGSDGGVFCWGRSEIELGAGDGPYTFRAGVVAPLLNGAAASLSMGSTHACALMIDTTVQCWSVDYDSWGLGVGQLLYSGTSYPLSVLVTGVTARVHAGVVADPNDVKMRTLSVSDEIVISAGVEGIKPTGTVDFLDAVANRVCSAVTVAKQNTKYEYASGPVGGDSYFARCTVPKATRSPGMYKWTAHYSGDVNHTTADSTPATIKLEAGPARFRDMVEFRNGPLDYYFVTSRQNEIDLLDAATANGWVRTGVKFRVATQLPGAANTAFETKALTRFYFDKIALGQSRGSHFYTMNNADRDLLRGQNPQNLQIAGKPYDEGTDSYVFNMLPGRSSCGYSGFQSVFRLFRTKADDPNHRYTTDPAVVDSFMAAGWRFESTAFCALP